MPVFPQFPRRALAVSLVLLLGACASTHGLAPEGTPLDADTLALTRSAGPLSAADFPRQDWWTALGDPQLDRLVEEALAGTPTLALADARVREAIAQAGLADAARKPTIAASGQYSGVLIPESVAPEPLGGSYKGVFLLGLNLKYAPDLWGGQRARWQAALGQAHAAEVEAQDARLVLASNVAHAYVGLAQAFAAQDVADAEHARASGLLALGRQRVDAGLDNQVSLRQAESAVAAAAQQREAAQQQIDAARTALAALLGKGPDRGLDIARPALLQAPAPAIPDVLPSELLGHRPDVVAARWQVEAASHGIAAAKAAFRPSVNLSALVGAAAGNLVDLFDSDALLLQGGPAISLPIFDGGRLRSELAQSDAQYDLAVARYNQTLVGALREVMDALQAARSLDGQLAAAQQARDAADAALALATQRYRAGLATQLDVLAAQRPLLQLDQQLAALRAQRLAATVDLDRALGGGLVLIPPVSDIARAPTP
ncbi:MAG TPA: efflux transporter outer membrane subunit [Xanthomonadaceae bacterium]|nr:efflux transporter outer membrane subunit [Xanthomonadaceae bacterium]